MKRLFALILIASLCSTLFSLPASAEGNAVPDGRVVDIVTPGRAVAALMADGTVRTAGMDGDAVALVASWTDIVQIAASGGSLFGLRSDGSVVTTRRCDFPYMPPEEPPFDPDRWTNVKALVSSEYEYYALTNDGRVLVSNDAPATGSGGGKAYLDWKDVEKLCWYAYPESRGLIGLCRDGTVLRACDYYPFNRTPKDVVDFVSSGYIDCAVCADGTVCVAGQLPTDSAAFVKNAAALRDVAQAAVNQRVILCRLRSGKAVICNAGDRKEYPGVRTWRDIRDVRLLSGVAVGLDSGGRIHTAARTEDNYALLELRREAESWTDVVRIEVSDGFGTREPYILGWRSDGTVLAAGIDLSGLKLDQARAGGCRDAVVVMADPRSDSGTAALREDGTVACAGLTEEKAKIVESWRGIVQICRAGAALYGLRADGYVEGISLVEDTGYGAELQAEVDRALQWRDITALVPTSQRLVGLKKDGSVAVGGPAHFGTEEKADFSGWTDLVALEGGGGLGGEYLIGIKKDGSVLVKGDSISGDWTGTPRRVRETACSGYQLLCLQQDGRVVSRGFPGVKTWRKITQVRALDGLALGLREDGSVAVEAYDWYPEEMIREIESWKNVRSLSVAGGELVVGVTDDGQTLVAGSDMLLREYGRKCIETIRSWRDLDRILGVDREGHVLAIRTDGSLVSFGIALP